MRTTFTTKDSGKETYYYHRVLEAKIILGDKLVISLDTEFIENEKEDAERQDCEISAAKRLLGRLQLNDRCAERMESFKRNRRMPIHSRGK